MNREDVYTKGNWTNRWADDNPKGTFIQRTINGSKSAHLVCKGCGTTVSLGTHIVAANGEVHPSVVCPIKGCGYHQWVTLEGWQA